MTSTHPPTACRGCGHSLTRPDVQPQISPIPELLQNGIHVLAPAQVDAVRASISTATDDVSQLESEISRIEGVLDELRRKRDDLKSYIDLHGSFLAPIAKLPTEILAEIFMQCTDNWMFGPLVGAGIIFGTPPHHLDKIPLLVSSVCKKWRHVALATPNLWASFALLIQPLYFENDVRLMELWLARAAQCPLSISLEYSRHHHVAQFLSDVKPLMEVFLSCCDRWENIRIHLPPSFIRLLSPARSRTLKLQWLFVASPSNSGDQKMQIFEVAPQLRHLKVHRSFDCSKLTIPWSQLQTCDLGMNRPAQEYLRILTLTPNLQSCNMENIVEPASPHAIDIQVQLPKLHTFKVSMLPGSNPGQLFKALQLPGLQYLSIFTEEIPWTETVTAHLISLLSHCSLKKLSMNANSATGFRTDGPSPEDMIRILQACPDLTELHLADICACCLSDTFLARFTCQTASETPELVPALQNIHIHYYSSVANVYFFKLDIMAFANAVRSSGAGLKRVILDYSRCEDKPPTLSSTAMSHLRLLKDEGWDIRMPKSSFGMA